MQSVICQRCGKRPATLHLTEIAVSGMPVEAHLCTTCIQQLGLASDAPPPPIATLLATTAAAGTTSTDEGQEASATTAPVDCPRCGMSFADFESGKRFGCAHDYSAWEDAIAAMLAGYHGADQHVGRRPGTGVGDDRLLHRTRLDAALRSAVANEDYEAAAHLRDELRRLEQP